MDKTIAALLGSASALALIGNTAPVSAAPVASLQPAQTYAELLDPVPNAAEVLKTTQATPSVELAQYYGNGGGPYYHHHHHHHHHHTFYYGYAPYPRYHHHHHHHQRIVIPVPLPGY